MIKPSLRKSPWVERPNIKPFSKKSLGKNQRNSNTYHVFFSNLANPLRINIISSLKQKSMSVGELSEKLKVEQSKLSHALANLRDCNLVSFEQKGKERIYSLNRKTMLPILELIDAHAKLNCKGTCKFCVQH